MSAPTRMKSTNQDAWSVFLRDNPQILRNVNSVGFHDVSSDSLNELREARLMCKMDFREKVPPALAEHGLSVLATANGTYRIARTNSFIDIDIDRLPVEPEKEFTLPAFIETLSANDIQGEGQALDVARGSGMIDYLLDGESWSTMHGRRYAKSFSFTLTDVDGRPIQYDVDNVQVEVDTGFETRRHVAQFEAKIGRPRNNMSIRQLLYPLLGHPRVPPNSVKTTRSYAMFYRKPGLFLFLPFFYRSGVCGFDHEGARLFSLKDNTETDPEVLFRTPVCATLTGHGAPFPQADSLANVIDVLLLLGEKGEASAEALFGARRYTHRQWDYYLNALLWLGFARRDADGLFRITPDGTVLFNSGFRTRLLMFGQRAFSNAVFNAFLHNDDPDLDERMLRENGLDYAASTLRRRLQTVRSWKRHLIQALFPTG